MFPPAKPRKPDRLDEFPKGTLLHEEVKAEFQRIRTLIRELTDKGGAIVLGVDHPRGDGFRFEFRLPQDALAFGCTVPDLQGVIRRMAKSRELRYETYEWEHPLLKGQVWKWYVKREDWDEKRRSRSVRAGDDDQEAGGGGGGDILDGGGNDEWE